MTAVVMKVGEKEWKTESIESSSEKVLSLKISGSIPKQKNIFLNFFFVDMGSNSNFISYFSRAPAPRCEGGR